MSRPNPCTVLLDLSERRSFERLVSATSVLCFLQFQVHFFQFEPPVALDHSLGSECFSEAADSVPQISSQVGGYDLVAIQWRC